MTLGDGERVGKGIVPATSVAVGRGRVVGQGVALILNEAIQFMVATGSGATSPATR